jgi:amino acid adenylation domain-containing protein
VKWLEQRDAQQAKEFWQTHLGNLGEPSLLGSPAIGGTGQNDGGGSKQEQLELSEALSEALQALKGEHIERDTLICGALAIVLSHYSGKYDVVFGVTLRCHPPDLDAGELLIGPALNTVPLRIRISPLAPAASWLKEVQVKQSGVSDFGFIPLDKIREWVSLPTDSPLFDTRVVFENCPSFLGMMKRVAGLEIFDININDNHTSSVVIDTANAKALIDRTANEFPHFDQKALGRLMDHMKTIFRAMASCPNQPLSELQVLSEREAHQLLVESNRTERNYAEDKCIHELFEQQAITTPDAIAIVYEEQELSYSELNRRANQLARYLRARGVGPEVKVGVCLQRGVEMVVALLGVLKAGGAYVPISPDYPEERLAFMLEDSRMPLIITRDNTLDKIPSHWGQSVCIDTDWGEIGRLTGQNVVNLAGPDHLAYVIYTSGSTGQPKGVAIPHRGVCNLVSDQVEFFDITRDSRILQFASISFDASVSEIFTALVSGARIIIGNEERMAGGRTLLEEIRRHSISVVTLPPSVIATLPEEELAELRTLVSAGESCPGHLVDKWSKGRKFVNAYGPTEVTVCATMNICESGLENPPIGKPMANKKIYLLNRLMQPVPERIAGEIHIGGEGLARCYVNRPELTAERFIPNPFSISAGDRLYRSGDLGSFLEDGRLLFLGRSDHQVKVRGYRIELSEVEAAFKHFSEIEEVAVVAVEEENLSKSLVAYVVVGEGQLDRASLKSRLRDGLPDYMIPSKIVVVPKLPLTPNGKLDRKALGEIHRIAVLPEHKAEGVALLTPTQQLLISIFEQVLSVDHISIDDNFFDLGGHSLLAARVIFRIQESFNIDLSVKELFEHPSVGSLAQIIDSKALASAGLCRPPILASPKSGPRRLSFAQQRLWFIDQMEPDTSLYNIGGGVRMEGELDDKALERAINEVVRRHEVLRTSIVTIDGVGYQEVKEWQAQSLPVIELGELREESRRAELERLIKEEVVEPFKLSEGRLLRAKLIRESEEGHTLLYTMHHIITDDWSMTIFIREIAEHYERAIRGETERLEELKLQYGDYAEWQRGWLEGEELDRQMSYWRKQLGGELPRLELPTRPGRPTALSYRGWQEVTEIEHGLTDRLKRTARQENVTLFMALVAAYSVLLSPYAMQDEVWVCSISTGRTRAEISGLIGFFLNNLVLRIDLRGKPSFRQLLSHVRATVLEAYAHQDLPFNKLVEELQPERTSSRTPLGQVVLNFIPFEGSPIKLSGITITPVAVPSQLVPFNLAMNVNDSGHGLLISLQYNTDLFSSSTIKGMLTSFEAILATVDKNLDLTIDQLKQVIVESKARILHEEEDRLNRARIEKFTAIRRRGL